MELLPQFITTQLTYLVNCPLGYGHDHPRCNPIVAECFPDLDQHASLANLIFFYLFLCTHLLKIGLKNETKKILISWRHFDTGTPITWFSYTTVFYLTRVFMIKNRVKIPYNTVFKTFLSKRKIYIFTLISLLRS